MVHNMSKTKIVVIHLKEILYTALFTILGILLIVVLVFLFFNKKDQGSTETMIQQMYTPGVWTTSLKLNDTTLNLEVIVNETEITSVRFVNIDEAVTTMYPLVKPTMESIEEAIKSGTSLEDIALSEDSKFTESLLIDAVETAVNKAKIVSAQ